MAPDSSHLAAAPSGKGEQTKQQLVAAAQKLFAERGFRGTSIRDIAKEAGSNVAAVNYHFGSKDNLYREVFRRHKSSASKRGIAAVQAVMEESGGKPEVEAVLEAFAQASEKRRQQGDSTMVVLIYREMVEPQLGQRFLLDEVIEPLRQTLGEALEAACPDLSATAIDMCIHSFLAQLGHLDQLKYYFTELDAKEMPMLDSTAAINHIVRFTSAGIKALQEHET